MTEDTEKLEASKTTAETEKIKSENEVDYDQYFSKVVTIDIPAGPQCYCMSPRNFSVPDFQCSVCYRWFHLDCIAFNIGKSLPFLTAYHFMCKKCNSNGEEVFSRKQANFAVMCQTALANLMWRNGGRLYFSKEKELIPFLEEYWEELTTQPRRSNNSWYPNIHKTLTSSDAFKTVEKGTDLLVCLSNTDLGKMAPSYDRFRALTSQLRTNITKLGVPIGNAQQMSSTQSDGDTTVGHGVHHSGYGADGDGTADGVGWRKRKSPGSGMAGCGASNSGNYGNSAAGGTCALLGSSGFRTGSDSHATEVNSSAGGDYNMRNVGGRGNGNIAGSGNGSFGGSLVRSTRRTAGTSAFGGATAVGGISTFGDEGRAKLNALGFPIDHPLNKESYRYILVELDKHATGRDLWDECECTAGKPIPGLFYRVYLSPQVVISLNDRANHLKLHESQLSVTGDKGYCMCRATHSVRVGTWYYEATITEQPEGAATRIGWSLMLGNLQAPCGYDKFSYSWRSRLGTVFHESRGKHYAESGYKKDDVIGCMIYLPTKGAPLASLENTMSETVTKTPVPGTPEGTTVQTKADLSNEKLQTKQDYGAKAKPKHTPFPFPETYKDRPLIKFRNSYYFEEKDEPAKAEKQLVPLPGSKIVFYRNGECMGTAFTDIYEGFYYPAISIYRSATVSVNFGPNFRFPPKDVTDWHPMTDRLVSAAVEQTLSDMLYLIEHEGFVEQMIKNYSQGP
ncbi:unnamed protein product [Calicophoron daubneyi]|uniref:SPRY domain-containing protein n=1 Tax=Calicophoron daubneyi TaxID=300641 RepID=A0AAV2TV61_CALDB